MLIINGQIKKYIRQLCKCSDSYCINTTEFGKAEEIEPDKFSVVITETLDVCSKCGTPYEVIFDPSNIISITNIGEENAERKEEINSKGIEGNQPSS